MAFRIDPHEPLSEEIRRAAKEQIDRALAEIDDNGLSTEKTVHQVRKRCKKLRSLLRLVRYELGKQYKRENAWYRDAAAGLSDLRDSHVLGSTYDAVTLNLRANVDAGTLTALRERLLASVAPADAVPDENEALQKFRAQMVEARGRIDEWPLKKSGFNALRPGLQANYKRARKAMRRACKKQDPALFHEWRKRVKYHTHHLHLLASAWKKPMKALEKEASHLGDLLGEDHDLAVLQAALKNLEIGDNTSDPLHKVEELIATRQGELRAQALHLGRRLFAEKPGKFGKRLKAWWKAA